MLWWRVGSENTNAAENDHMNRNPLNLLRQTTEKEKLRVPAKSDRLLFVLEQGSERQELGASITSCKRKPRNWNRKDFSPTSKRSTAPASICSA